MVASRGLGHNHQLLSAAAMRPIQHTSTLVYYDGVQVFEGRDIIGGHYVGVMIGSSRDADRYLVAGVPPERLRLFRTGELDLRGLLLDAGRDEWLLAESADGLQTPLKPARPDSFDRCMEWLPDEGLFLHDSPCGDLALREARSRNSVILDLRMEPPETAHDHRIRAETLGVVLCNIQNLIRYAYRNAVSDRKERERGGHLMDVVAPAEAGSFRVILAAVGWPDLFGACELSKGLERMDSVFESAADPKTARERMSEHQGHLASSYIRLMGVLSTAESGMWYAWAAPDFHQAKQGGVSKSTATVIFNELSKSETLGVEKIDVVGSLHKVNRKSGTWGLATEYGIRSGKSAEDGPDLNGLVVGERYEFHCFEKIEQNYATGTDREKRTLYLKSIDSA